MKRFLNGPNTGKLPPAVIYIANNHYFFGNGGALNPRDVLSAIRSLRLVLACTDMSTILRNSVCGNIFRLWRPHGKHQRSERRPA
jgi:hypothetical protein